MKIEILENEIKLNVDGKLQRNVKGDIVTVTDEIGAICCQYGWAKDADGTIETGERKPGANGPVVPDGVKQKIK